ncbi:MAG TPA: hypothetical protein PLO33_06800 [Kouleothrix sp.]|uniref:hypothetical protein n=1 Tax=Kouleothrix sp. TaxID=2779161 RepID=UPI002C6DEE18|nr:hypothetical protein [Kouleothrix sp.]HRC75369.1 hypothetical protein [Kouleothrix sp.]
MRKLLVAALLGVAGVALARWYNREVVREGDALVHLQSEHDHFHLHVDMPPELEIEPGDTLHLLSVPKHHGQTEGELTYPSRVRLYKASWLKRYLVKRSSLAEINELVEHP